MAQQGFLDKVREWIGGVAWAIFLWSARMTEDEYFSEQDRAAELQRAPVRAEQVVGYCRQLPHFFVEGVCAECGAFERPLPNRSAGG